MSSSMKQRLRSLAAESYAKASFGMLQAIPMIFRLSFFLTTVLIHNYLADWN